jgi:hypothetical protein
LHTTDPHGTYQVAKEVLDSIRRLPDELRSLSGFGESAVDNIDGTTRLVANKHDKKWAIA